MLLVKTLVLVELLLLTAACDYLEQNPPPNIPATVVAESSTVVAEGATVAAEAASEAKQAVSTVVALVTPEPQPTSTRAVATPTLPPPTPTPEPVIPTPAPPSTLTPHNTSAQRAETIVTSLGRQVDVVVTGFQDNSLRFDQLVLAINHTESLLGILYPAPTVTMKMVTSIDTGFCGNNQPSYASGLEGGPYIVDGSTISIMVDEDCDEIFATIAHEAAHTWFHGSDEADWIDEGLANAIERQVRAAYQPDEAAYPPVSYCRNYANISQLELAQPPKSGEDPYGGFSCNYRLGDGIFGSLMGYYGDGPFNQRITRLARKSVNDTRRSYTIDDVRNALGGDTPSLDIINLWYQGQPEMRQYLHLDAVEWTFPPTIDGEYLHFEGRTSEPEVVSDFILGDHPYCSQFSLLSDIADLEWVASISDPLTAGWALEEIPEVMVINDRISPQTGEFSVTARINDPALAGNPGLSLLVTGLATAGSDDICEKSVRYSQIQVTTGTIPNPLKEHRHYHADAIQWISPPIITGNTMTFSGRGQPGAIALEWREGYCNQFSFYELDQWGYRFIDSLDPKLPGGQFWAGPLTGAVTHYRIGGDGSFEATARISAGALDPYNNPVLVVTAMEPVDSVTRECGYSEVLSALDIQRN